jgi:hypothetical protein
MGPGPVTIHDADDEEFGKLVHLRVEVQHLIRLPESGSICFLIRSYLLPFADLVTIEDGGSGPRRCWRSYPTTSPTTRASSLPRPRGAVAESAG